MSNTVKTPGKGGKYDYDKLRVKCLIYLHENRKNHGERTFSKIMKKMKFNHSSVFNKMMYFLIGAGLVQEDKVGSTWLYSLTDAGIMYIERNKK